MENNGDFSDDDIYTFNFIELIKKHPSLYAKRNKAYRNIVTKEKAWLTIANSLKLTRKYLN